MSKKSKSTNSKYSYGSSNGYKKASSFWYDDYDYDYDVFDTYGGWGDYTPKQIESYKKTNNLYKLSSVRRAIANFVQIVTNKSIPVTFATKSDSKTDGERVILSADVDDKFDVSVGLALHEGSHIVLSDFKLLAAVANLRDKLKSADWNARHTLKQQGIETPTPEQLTSTIDKIMKDAIRPYPNYKDQMNDIALSTGRIGKFGTPTDEVMDCISGLTNWIEDRRIDHYIYKSAPGYRDYYTSMYDHYFNDKVVTKGIDSDEFTDETINSYMFRIINFLNEKTDLNKLKALRAIYRKLDLKNIDRIKSSTEAMALSIDIVELMLETIANQNNGQIPQSGFGQGQGQGGGNGSGDPADINEIDDDTEIQMGDGENENMGGATTGINVSGGQQSTEDTKGSPSQGDATGGNKLSKTAAEQLAKKFQKQKDFLNGNIKKKNVTKEEMSKLNDIQESESELVRVGGDLQSAYGRIGQGVDCIVVKRLTSNLLKSDDFPFASYDYKTKEPQVWAEDEVKRGITLGTLLGKKLQIRGESRETIFSRLKKGKIDKRMIASLGYDNDGVFYTNEIDQYKKANLHISLDYSGSMGGSKLKRTITSVVAIVKACEMARNLNVQVSIRSTDRGRGGKSLPYICLVHDSRRDSFKQFCKYMSILDCNNTTPEGLCFEAIQKYLIPTDNNVDSYFLNFSDGQPAYHINSKTDSISYSGVNAAQHTYKQVKKMMANGINVLSYFITDRYSDSFENSNDWDIFKKSYGSGAKHVNVENVMQVARSMNDLFLSKPNKQ